MRTSTSRGILTTAALSTLATHDFGLIALVLVSVALLAVRLTRPDRCETVSELLSHLFGNTPDGSG